MGLIIKIIIKNSTKNDYNKWINNNYNLGVGEMYKIPLSDLKEKLVSSGKISAEELEIKIKDKINELSGLISEEGASHIIANELGVEVVSQTQQRLKVKEVYAGMKTVTTLVKVIQKYEVREFSKGDNKGKVCSLFVGDETGVTRLVFWNEQVDQLIYVNENDILLVKDAYARDNNGRKEKVYNWLSGKQAFFGILDTCKGFVIKS